jgi:hypothetical protein
MRQCIRTAKIRRIRGNPRAIGVRNSPLISADLTDQRGSRQEEPYKKTMILA